MTSRALRLYRAGSLASRLVPFAGLVYSAEVLGALAARRSTPRTAALATNLAVVLPDADRAEIDRRVRLGYASYGRYWAETFRLPTMSAAELEAGLRVTGFGHIEASRRRGLGPILVLPHLGGWEWAAAYLGRVARIPVSAVVERLHPDDMFEWFVDLRSSYGVSVIPVGADAVPRLIAAVRAAHVVCLLSDRDVAGGGVEVQFFGRSTTMPAGPALLARRTGAPIHPTAVYFATSAGQRRSRGHHCVIESAVEPADTGKLRSDVAATTQRIAHALERLIERAPEQWHVLEPLFEPAAAE